MALETQQLTPETARKAFTAKLASSGLSAADAAKLQISLLSPKQTRALNAAFFESWSIKLPYHDPRGKTTGLYRIRYLGDPRPTAGFAAHTSNKIPRYMQPPDTEPGVYLPVGIGLTKWPDFVQDPRCALLITEGELKAACAANHGYPTIGLGGVWSWRSAKKGQDLIPLLRDGFIWEARDVYIIFDSDMASNPQVLRALEALCAKLTTKGAIPRVVRLPELPDFDKTGLDDFLVNSAQTDFTTLLNEAQIYSTARELWALNSRVAYVRNPAVVVERETGQIIQPATFTNHLYSNLFYVVSAVTAAGVVKIEEKPLAPAWIKWPFRSELRRFTYAPGKPELTDDREYNFWRGWGCKPQRGDVTPWTELLDYMFASEPAARTWFERWCAYPIQHPGTKLYTAAVMWGAQTGTGKSLIGYSLIRVYGKNSGEINDQHLQSDFNEWAVNQQFIMGDDVVSGENKRHVADRLKALITQLEMRVNQKFLPSYVVPDCINYYFTSNHSDAFFLEDADRRYFVHEAPYERLPIEFYKRYDKWVRSAAGPAALHYHLAHLPLGDFDPHAEAIETRAKRDMIVDNKTDLAAWVHELRTQPEVALRAAGPALESDLLTCTQLLAAYDPEGNKRVTTSGMGRELKRAGFMRVWTGPVRTQIGLQRLWVVRNTGAWGVKTKPQAAAAYWDARFARFDPSASKKY